MDLDADAAYQALTARDARFDGRLFVGVTSTGVYCRPICRVRTPQRRNCRFFATPAQAEAAAFRPCLKCRPEIAPGPGLPWTVMDASRTLARQAADELDTQAGSGDAPALTAVAARLGVSDRHLRRIFAAEHGVTPLQYLQTRRLLLAKQLLTDTALPVAQVALASGFRSLRRFNAAFAESYRMSPSRLRGAAADESPASERAPDAVTVTLAFRAPYDRPALLRFVAQRAIPGIEQVTGLAIRRSLRAGSVAPAAGWIEAEFLPAADRVRVRFAAALAPASAPLLGHVRRWLDLDAAPAAIAETLADLPGTPGIRLPGSLDSFELAVRAVLGQQVTVAAARTLARRLVERFGTPLATPWPEITLAFPAPEALTAVPLEHIAELGIVRTRAQALLELSRAWPSLGGLLAGRGEPQALIDALTALPGIGAWTAHYIAMRAFGWSDAFPPNDVAVLKAMRQCFGPLTPRAALARAEAWRPWRAYAVLRLWNSLSPTP
ncbi:MAG: helix-turn-helix domain-containing protein [Piscinibacter sp.]|nr:helix-turn-helix domain-containing protein [Piscinibacter sp.]